MSQECHEQGMNMSSEYKSTIFNTLASYSTVLSLPEPASWSITVIERKDKTASPGKNGTVGGKTGWTIIM